MTTNAKQQENLQRCCLRRLMPFKRHVSHGAGELSRSPRRWCEPSSRRRWVHVMRLLRWRKATCTCTLRWRKLACTWRRKPLVRRRRKSTHRSSLFKNDTASFSLDECVALEGRRDRQGREGCLVCRCSVSKICGHDVLMRPATLGATDDRSHS